MNITYNYYGMRNDVWKNLGEEEAKRRIEDLIIAKGYTEDQAFTEVYAMECALDDDE